MGGKLSSSEEKSKFIFELSKLTQRDDTTPPSLSTGASARLFNLSYISLIFPAGASLLAPPFINSIFFLFD